MKYPLLYLVYRIKTLHYMLSPNHPTSSMCVCPFPLLLKELKPLTGVNLRKHSFITLLIPPSLVSFIIESCNSSQHFTIHLHSSLRVNEWSPGTLYASSLLDPVWQLFSLHFSTFSPFFFPILSHRSLPSFTLHTSILQPAIPGTSVLVITLRKRQSGDA